MDKISGKFTGSLIDHPIKVASVISGRAVDAVAPAAGLIRTNLLSTDYFQHV